jgi:acetate kinase
MSGCIAVLNAGSSSIKIAVYEPGSVEAVRYRGRLEQIGVSPHLEIFDAQGMRAAERSWRPEALDQRAATHELLQTAADLVRGTEVSGVGHRVVHGGMRYAQPVRVDPEVMGYLASLSPLAPLHQPYNLAAIEEITEAAPHIPQVACFDTAFHRTQSELAQAFALPRKYAQAGVRRYGFHGLSYEYVASRLRTVAPELAEARVVVAHLGNGASLCALHRGKSVASTMGFTAVDGLVMGTRCGTIDAGAIIYLMDAYGMDARALETLIYRQSGLLGVSGVSSDMRVLRESDEPAAAEAIALFVYRIVRETGSLAAAMGGLDGIVFTGGIGENDAATRAGVAKGVAWLGLELDEAANRKGAGRISAEESSVTAWVVPTDEESMVARHTARVLGIG